ncbi:MAG TPA: fumarylacetoacetase [Pseudonocardiaceae bacterium]|nr:fumarylacetoacetase [Pseudonocardiaceae bacterium]
MTWIGDPAFGPEHPFGPQTLPYGVFSVDSAGFRSVGVRVGDHVLDISALPSLPAHDLLVAGSLDPLLAAGRQSWDPLRAALADLVLADTAPPGAVLHPVSSVRMHLPFTVADYVDFYSSRHHAENAGRIFRPDSEPLLPNWTHLPVGYHGRAGTVVVSGTEIVRPCGQSRPRGAEGPVFGPSRRLDIEAEVGFVCGGPVSSRVPVDEVEEHVFGVALVNDWSARDVQAWEYQPLGPFLGKSFATSIAAWITPLAALRSARVELAQPPHPLVPYLRGTQPWGLDLTLQVRWNGTVVTRPPFATMSWSCAQQLAHLTVNGATVRPGDLFASGTVSGPSRDQVGSFLELSWGGREPITLDSGDSRTFLEDGDEVVITATAPGPSGSVVGFGEVAGRVTAGPGG